MAPKFVHSPDFPGFFQCTSLASVFQSLLLVIAGATQKELARHVKYLKVENDILRGKWP